MNNALHLLIVEDSEDDTLLIVRELKRGGYDLTYERVDTAEAMASALDRQGWDLIIADYTLPRFSAPAALQLLQSKGLDLPFIIASGTIGEEIAVAAMKVGAHDYLMKNNLTRLVPAVDRELREAKERQKRRQAEEALRHNEDRFRTLLENALDIILVLNLDGTIRYVSPSVERVLGYASDTLMQRDVFDYLDRADRRRIIACFVPVIRSADAVVSVELQVRYGQGGWRSLEAVGQQFVDQDEVTRLVVNCRDITEQQAARRERQQAEEVRKALEKEKELNDLKSRFVSMVSHEFRTPLNVVMMSATLLERFSQHSSEDKKQQYFNRIQAAVKRMTQLLDEVLFLGQVEADRLEFKPVPLDLVQLCREIVDEVQLIDHGQHAVEFKASQETLLVSMDEVLVRHIFTNLLSNAIKYSPQEQSISFHLTCEDDQAIFRVTDQGIGISETDLKRLFESFHRGKNVGKIPGTGLGLAIVKQSIDLHKGQIQVTSTLGVGTTFLVKLPLFSGRSTSEDENVTLLVNELQQLQKPPQNDH